jgi:hypothetical protein
MVVSDGLRVTAKTEGTPEVSLYTTHATEEWQAFTFTAEMKTATHSELTLI